MQKVIDEFLEYTSSFFTLLNDSYDIYNINLKINHTFRDCRIIKFNKRGYYFSKVMWTLA